MSNFQPNTEGVFFDLPEDVYRAAPGINFSTLKHATRSMAHYQAALSEPEKDASHFAVGKLAHAMVLEDKDLRDLYAIKPAGMSFATKDGKAWRDAQTLPILKEDDANAIPQMAESLAKNPDTRAILERCTRREVAVFKLHKPTGLLLKGRLDIIGEDQDGNTVVSDVKTTQDASDAGFEKTLANLQYDEQAAYYLDLIGASFFVALPVEKSPPFACQALCIGSRTIAHGREKNERNLARVAECIASGIWPAYPSGIRVIDKPEWAFK